VADFHPVVFAVPRGLPAFLGFAFAILEAYANSSETAILARFYA